MDFMFEDEVDEVGSDVEAYCPKCKADTTHVVISKYEDEIRRVQCNPCGDVHSYRKPRGEVEDDVPEPIAAKKRALLKKQNWDEFFTKYPERHGKPYEFREAYTENTIVTHPKFGKGFVSEVISDSKVEVTFKDARRVLVHNRKDMPGLPLAAEGDGIPFKVSSKAKPVKGKAAGKEAAPPASVAAPPAPAQAPAQIGKPANVPAPATPKAAKISVLPPAKGASAPHAKATVGVAPAATATAPAPTLKAVPAIKGTAKPLAKAASKPAPKAAPKPVKAQKTKPKPAPAPKVKAASKKKR
jgi:Zn ribbon nucleic-acid-binding protein